ncbi:MAG: GAF domain-containing protein [Chloroflexi bacterium]|nr:GAF domain-containing protein [Chloroflexota bacterium]
MNRRASDPLITFTALLLLALGQSALLIPQRLATLLERFPDWVIVMGGFFFHLIAIVAVSQIPIPTKTWKIFLAYAALALGLLALCAAYVLDGRIVEASIFSGCALLIPVSVIQEERATRPDRDYLIAAAAVLNLAAGLGLLAWPALLTVEAYQPITPYRPTLAALFLITALLGGAGVGQKNPNLKGIFGKSMTIPWLGWALVFGFARDLAGIIPALGFSLCILITDMIPWSRLKLTTMDILGKRIIVLTAILQTAFLVAVVFLLENAKIENISSVSGWGFFQLNNSELAFLLIMSVEILLLYSIISFLMILHGPARKAEGEEAAKTPGDDSDERLHWTRRIERLIGPLATAEPDTRRRAELNAQQIQNLSDQLAAEKRRTAQLTLLSELSQQLESQLDVPVASQLAVNTLQRSLNCTLVALYIHDQDRRELVALASAGTRLSGLPPGYRQGMNAGVLGRAARLRKTQVISDSRLETEFVKLNDEKTHSIVAIPLVDHGHLKAMLEISDDRVNAFGSSDVQIAEAVAAELLRAWERSEYHQRLTELIQAGISLTTQPDPQAAVQEVASITRQTLRARFAFVTLLDQEGNFTRTAWAGQAPRLLKSLRQNPNNEPLMQAALNSMQTFRVRDIRKYKYASHIDLDMSSLRSMIAIPIRMHRLSVGAMLAFGKQGEVFFTENDESLASLLSSQAAAAIESAWLSHELRSNLASATQLYQLSFHIIQAQELTEGARYIAETAQKVSGARSAGIILLTPDKKVEAEVQLDEKGEHTATAHPMELVQRAMDSGQSIFLSSEEESSNVCFPLKTAVRSYGALWLSIPDRNNARYATNLQTLANQAAVALERSILLVESRAQARELEAAYRELETTYDHTLIALMSALDARDRETEGHSLRVARIAGLLGKHLELNPMQRKALERGSLLHDIGKIGISDTILHKPGPLDVAEWKIMRLHPDIGARIVEGIPFLQDTLSVVRYHQERWDGSGYPVGLSGKDIPYLARIFAVADAFDALTSNRPYRTRVEPEEAVQYLREQAGILFDPLVVQTLEELSALGSLEGLDGQ